MRHVTLVSLAAALGVLLMPVVARAETVRLYVAGSLKAVMTEMTVAFEAATPVAKAETTLGASGLLRERIEKGEAAHVFVSADTGHPKWLADRGRAASPIAVFARNELCALVRPGFSVTAETLLETMLDKKVRVGTSTPKADPSGDYAFALFGKSEVITPGAKAILEGKALQLTGGPTSERAPESKNLYGWVMAANKADVFLTYCTNAVQAKSEVPSLSIVEIPKALNVGADYGLIVLKDAPSSAEAFAAFIRSPARRGLLIKYGFGAGD